MLLNTLLCLFLLSLNFRWVLCCLYSKTYCPGSCKSFFYVFVTLGGFCYISNTLQSAFWTQETRWNISKQCSERTVLCYFWSIVGKHGIHIAHSFFISKCLCKIFLIRSVDIVTMSSISPTFTLRSSEAMLRILLVFSGINVAIRCRERAVFTVLVGSTFKFSESSTNACFRWSRCAVMLC